jgi:hypothetical protein
MPDGQNMTLREWNPSKITDVNNDPKEEQTCPTACCCFGLMEKHMKGENKPWICKIVQGEKTKEDMFTEMHDSLH